MRLMDRCGSRAFAHQSTSKDFISYQPLSSRPSLRSRHPRRTSSASPSSAIQIDHGSQEALKAGNSTSPAAAAKGRETSGARRKAHEVSHCATHATLSAMTVICEGTTYHNATNPSLCSVRASLEKQAAAAAQANAPLPDAGFFSNLSIRPKYPESPLLQQRADNGSSEMTVEGDERSVSKPTLATPRPEGTAAPSSLARKQEAIARMTKRLGMGIETALEQSMQPKENVGVGAEVWVEKADVLAWPRRLLGALAHV